MRERINRALWNCLRTSGDPVETRTSVSPLGVDVEDFDGWVRVSVLAREDGVEVHIHDLEVIVKKDRVTLLQRHPPYPIEKWTILWEGEMD